MATNSLITFFFILTIILLSCHTLPSLSSSQHQDIADSPFVRQLDPNTFSAKREKLSQFRFYWHDTLSGINPTSVTVIPPPFGFSKLHNDNTFGLVNVIDNPLTLGPELNSTLVGKAQGFYVSASQTEFDLLMAMNFAFVVGKYNGSTITVLGRNPIYNKVRELPVIGGSGLFRFARGYAEARTHWFEPNTGDAVVEYTVYVFHY